MNQDILHLSGLHTVLSGRTILHDISFTVDRGSVLSIIGPNGAGKSTLLRAILGILPSTGQITLDGTPLRSLTQRQIARKVAYVPQTVELVFPLTVGEFLKLSRYPHLSFAQVFGKHDEEIVRRAMELTHVTEFEERTLQSLSGGERQRVLVAAALAQEPGILLLDEELRYSGTAG